MRAISKNGPYARLLMARAVGDDNGLGGRMIKDVSGRKRTDKDQ